mmetsp:Transcript_8564/g.17097  ORF Transcript_8564/g.17097 Transcript_8564/m.17097 type:complete len:243 (+) Transcript_8564:195-923(+)
MVWRGLLRRLPVPHRPIPQHLWSSRNLEGRTREGACCIPSQGAHVHRDVRDVGRRKPDAELLLRGRRGGGPHEGHEFRLQGAPQCRVGRDGVDEGDGGDGDGDRGIAREEGQDAHQPHPRPRGRAWPQLQQRPHQAGAGVGAVDQAEGWPRAHLPVDSQANRRPRSQGREGRLHVVQGGVDGGGLPDRRRLRLQVSPTRAAVPLPLSACKCTASDCAFTAQCLHGLRASDFELLEPARQCSG